MSPSDSDGDEAKRRAHLRAKAAHCLDLAQRPEYRAQAALLVKMARRLMERSRARPD